jgi:hypothetical protein
MRKLQFWVSALFLITAVALAPFFAGCEDEPGLGNVNSFFSDNDTENQEREDGLVPLSIDPSLASISYVGERIALRAKGAVQPVTWSPANRAAATVNVVGTRTDYAVFQATQLAPNSVLAVDAAGRTATADITIGAAADALRIIPNSVTITNQAVSDEINFLAAGGAAPYGPWDTLFTSMGTVDGTGLYTVQSAVITGTNLVSVIDAAGDVATAVVVHE